MTPTRSARSLTRVRRTVPSNPAEQSRRRRAPPPARQWTSLREQEDHHRRGVHGRGEDVLGGRRGPHRQPGDGQRRQHQEADAAAEIAAINRDQELRDAARPGPRGLRPRRDDGGTSPTRTPRSRTAPARAPGWRRTWTASPAAAGAQHPAGEADAEQRAERQPRRAGRERPSGVPGGDLPGKERNRRGDVRRPRIEPGDARACPA